MKRLAILALAIAVIGCDSSKPAPAEDPDKATATNGSGNVSGSTGLGDPKPTEQKPAANLIGGTSDLKDTKPLAGEEVAVIDTKFGRIVLRFYNDKAPKHVENFKQLARKGFYDGTKFHRIIPNFMIQGGDPNTKDADPSNDGMGGPGYQVDAEFNEISHDRGILSMARSGDPNSAGSQFFIVHQPSYNLDTQYTVFGRVVFDGTEAADAKEPAGMKAVDKIVAGKTTGDNGQAVEPIEMKVAIQTWPIK